MSEELLAQRWQRWAKRKQAMRKQPKRGERVTVPLAPKEPADLLARNLEAVRGRAARDEEEDVLLLVA